MRNRQRLIARLPLISTAAAAVLGSAMPAAAQIEALRNGDDQYIQGLREQGMSDLLLRFSEVDPPEDPIARLALDVSLKEFIASDLLARATQASQTQDFAQANQLFLESRETFEGLLAAQRQLIADNQDDERLPIWQTDFAEMLIDRYLPRYFQNVQWHYEFGHASAEQKQAFEDAMVEALQVTMEASNRLSVLPNRRGNEEGLTSKLEEMQILYKLEDYTSINNPYWLAHAAHGVSLLPDDHAYFAAGDRVRGQLPTAKQEKSRLRNRVVDECSAALAQDERTMLTAKLLSGKTLVRSDDIDDIDDGVEIYLEPVIAESPGTHHGYLATLGKAFGRYNGGEQDIAETILNGMGNHQYVQADATVVSRLLAADMLFRILMIEAEDNSAKVAEAYEKAYIPLIDNDDDPRFKQVLFTRWADEVGDDQDPAALPATVRMGIGEQLTSQGGGQAQMAVQAAMQAPPAIPAEAERWRAQIAQQLADAEEILDRAVVFNTTLTGDEIEAGPVLARGLFNLGTNQYWLAELAKMQKEDRNIGWQPYFEVCKTWLSVAVRVPEADKAEEAITFTIGLLLPMDLALNKDSIREPEVRAVYKEAFELINERWPQAEAAHNNRLYAGFHLFEKNGGLEEAAEVYGALPSTHRDYFQAKRQMVYALHRNYRSQSDRLRLMKATQPLNTPPDGLNAQQIEEYNKKKELWQQQHDAISEDITRKRDLIIEEAELVMIDAEDVAENARETTLRFAAVTARGACRVVLAGMEADQGNTDKAMDSLKGFETQYSPAGPYKDLAALQPKPDGAVATLNGLVQSAQEQRILTLLDAKRTNEMTKQAEVMMKQSPDVAAAVVNGVLQRIRAEIDREKRAIEAAAFNVQRETAKENIRFFANAAVDLGVLLEQWAKSQGFDEKKMTAYQMPLAESLMLAGRGKDAIDIMEPILELYPNNFNVLIRTGRAHLAVYQQNKQASHYESAMSSFSKVVQYYNQRNEKPAPFWEAWLAIFELMDTAGGDPAASIPKRARMLYGVDENLGGGSFKEAFEVIIQRNGGVERLQPQPGVNPDQPAEDEAASLYEQLVPWPETFASL
ncbi:MAG: hypothetical protein AAGB26_05695 [Planctomycetota bacterium]